MRALATSILLFAAAASHAGGQQALLMAAGATAATTTVTLGIPPRLQWDELNGYCGECCIQQAALAFGTYVSQSVCRSIINPDQQSQLLVAVNDTAVLAALRLTSAEFNYSTAATPQFAGYFGWVKQQLSLRHPVMIVAYIKGMSDPDYDHIMLATGFTSSNTTTYLAADHLFFNDGYNRTADNRLASTLADTRRMTGNGATYEYCIPSTVCYGCAITGIQDSSHAALPVRVTLADWSEPDLIAGARPATLSATIDVSGLIVGKAYTLYRYNDYHNVPTLNYARSSYTSATNFTATKTTASFPALIPSNSTAVFRCLPAGK